MLGTKSVFSSVLKSFCLVCIIFVSVPSKSHASLSVGCLTATGIIAGLASLMMCCKNCLPDNSPVLPGERREGHLSATSQEEEEEKERMLSRQPGVPRSYSRTDEEREY